MWLICLKTANSLDKSINLFLGVKYPIRGSSGGLSGLKMGLIRPKTANSVDKSSFAKPNWYRALFYPRCGVYTDYSDIFHPFLGDNIPLGVI